MRKLYLILLLLVLAMPSKAAYLLIPMDNTQTNHLKAYGVAYWVLQREVEISWLLNYRGGSYLIPYHEMFERECKMRNVSYNVIADAQADAILAEIADPGVNMDEMKLQKVPRIAVYAPKNNLPWDDAVTLVLTYAEIPYDVIYDDEVLQGAPRGLHGTIWQVLGALPQLPLVSGGCAYAGSHGTALGLQQGISTETRCGQEDS